MTDYLIRYYEGSIPQYFVCKADDPEHAVEQCQNAYPEAVIDAIAEVVWHSTELLT